MTDGTDRTNTARQHGAMEHTIPPCDLDEVRRYRLARVREALAARDLAGIILYDPVNIRYAQMHPICRSGVPTTRRDTSTCRPKARSLSSNSAEAAT